MAGSFGRLIALEVMGLLGVVFSFFLGWKLVVKVNFNLVMLYNLNFFVFFSKKQNIYLIQFNNQIINNFNLKNSKNLKNINIQWPTEKQ